MDKKIILFFLLTIVNIYSNEKIYKSATEFDYPPFSVTSKGVADGFSVELLKAVCDEMNLKVSFKIDAWEIIKNELIEGTLDVLPLVGRTPEREDYFDFTIPYVTINGNIFIRDDEKDIKIESDLFGKEIIVMEGDNAHEYALRTNYTDKLILVKTYKEAFELLSSGKCDAVIAQGIVGAQIISDLKINNVKPVAKITKNSLFPSKINLSGFEQKFCFAVKEGDKDLLDKLNTGLVIVNKNGKYQKIFDKWFPFLKENTITIREFFFYLVVILIPVIFVILLIFIIYFKNQIMKKTRDLTKEIEEKCKIENRLNDSEEKYRIIAENTVECIWILDVMNKKFKYVSPSIFSLRGLTVEEAMEENFQDSLTPESLERVNNAVKERLPKFLNNESQEGYFDEVRQYCKDGSIKDIEISTKFMYDEKTGLPIVLGVSRDITERKIIVAKNAYHRNLLESSLDPLVTVDLNGKITDVNIATIKATGYAKEELVETDFSEYFTEPEKAREGYKKAFDLGEVRDYLLELKNKDGSIMTVAYNASVYRDENENVVGVFAAARDITEKKKMENELEKYRERLESLVKERTLDLERTNRELIAAKEKAEKASMAKSEFLSNMSHELRTPLNGILGFADILYDDETEPQKKDFLKIIKDSGAHLLTIINDILDISKIEAGMFRISSEPFDIKQSIKWIEDNFKEAIKIKRNKLTIVDKSESQILYGDELRIKQILTNLISNSNKFTESGEIIVEISEKNIDCGRVEVKFVVEDTGIGISEKKMKNLFQMFDQGERHLTKKYGGTGIGLAVVKKLIDLMNGEIFVKSEIGKGSLFEIKIPLRLSEMKPDNAAQQAAQQAAQEAESPESLDLSKYKILVADDCEINVLFVKMLLEETGATFDIVSDGNEVINIVKNNRYDLILMDSQMPNINGLEATKIIRNMENKTIAEIPIIALSAYALNEDIQKAFSYGINDYLSKPFSKKQLNDILNKWLNNREF